MLVTARKGPAEALTARDACGDSCHRAFTVIAMPACGRCGGTGAGMTTAALAASGLLIAIGSVPYLIETCAGPQSPR